MKLFNMDLHISVIEDFKNIFPEIEITHWCLSNHAWVFDRKTEFPDFIDPNTWKQLDETMIRNFQTRYDSFLQQFDGFICGFPGSFAMIFEKYNKPIIFMNAVRYDMPFCWSQNMDMLQKYKECLHRLNSKKLLIGVSNNHNDKLYMKLGCGLDTTYIPSLCGYTGMKYAPTRNTFLCYTGSIDHPLVTNKSQLGNGYKWDDLCKFKGIIHFPYDASTMSKFEQFTAGIPLFFPSKQYMIDNVNLISVTAYWGNNLPENLNQFSNKSVWVENSDMYTIFKSPNVYIFDSIPHLIYLLEIFEWKDDSKILENHARQIKEAWKSLLTI